jgi:hypothetical protein
MGRSLWRGMKHKEFQGDVKQQGGALILGPGIYFVKFFFKLKLESKKILVDCGHINKLSV